MAAKQGPHRWHLAKLVRPADIARHFSRIRSTHPIVHDAAPLLLLASADNVLRGLAAVLVLGVASQALASILRLPSILVLLLIGILIGPILGGLDPDTLLPNLVLPITSLSVALILYEGGLTLRFSELPQVGRVVLSLVTVGVLVTWGVAALFAWLIFGLDPALCVLIGAVLVVTGPTVVGPLIRHIRPHAPVGPILRWEGIVIDPVGALLAVLVFEVILATGVQHATLEAIKSILLTLLGGGLLGIASAFLLTQIIKRYWLPDSLINPMSVALVLATFTISDMMQEESGLFAVTVMGVALANQRAVDIRHIVEFKENLRVLLISSLFIILAARIDLESVKEVGLQSVLFAGTLILIARPLATMFSTIRSPLSVHQKTFIAWMAPRGIVAAAVAAVFGLRLEEQGQFTDANLIVPITFVVILVTVVVYGLTAGPMARWLKVADRDPQGLLIVGAHKLSREIAQTLKGLGFAVLLIDTNRQNIAAARLAGLSAIQGGVLSNDIVRLLDLTGIGRLLMMTANTEVNTLAVQNFISLFGRSEVFQLAPEGRDKKRENENKDQGESVPGRVLFSTGPTYARLASRVGHGASVKATTLRSEFPYADYEAMYADRALPLFVVAESGKLTVVTWDRPIDPKPGDTIIALVDAESPASEQVEPATPTSSPPAPTSKDSRT